jgi:hypothetical protein
MAPLIDIESKSASKCNEDLMKGIEPSSKRNRRRQTARKCLPLIP